MNSLFDKDTGRVTLELSADEAQWLHLVMMSSLADPGCLENDYDAEMRRRFFTATKTN